MPKVIRCAQCQTIIATLPDDDPHTFPAPVLCADCTRKKAQDFQSDIRPTSNDQTASKAGRARAKLQELLPRGATINAVQVNQHRATNGYSIYEYYLLATHPNTGRINLLNRYLRALGLGVNRKRGTIRSEEELYRVVELIGIRIYGDPDAFHALELDTTL